MEEDYKIIDHYLMIRLPEEIDHHSCSVICRRADHMMLDNSVSHIVFDFSDTKFMDSSGIGVLAGALPQDFLFWRQGVCDSRQPAHPENFGNVGHRRYRGDDRSGGKD